MEQGIVTFVLKILTAVGTFCTGIAAFVGLFNQDDENRKIERVWKI